MRFEIKSGTWTCFFTDFLALGIDSICLFRICFELFCTSGRRFWLLKSSPAPELISLRQILARRSDPNWFFRFRFNFFVFLVLDFGFVNQVHLSYSCCLQSLFFILLPFPFVLFFFCLCSFSFFLHSSFFNFHSASLALHFSFFFLLSLLLILIRSK